MCWKWVHGAGTPSAHSHYYLAKDHDHDHDHGEHADDHGHSHDENGSEKTHVVEIDVVTEIVDIVRWLPSIAGDGDMEKEAWEQVSSESKTLSDEIEKQVSDSMATKEKREALRGLDPQLSSFVATMSRLVDLEETTEAKGE